MGERTLAPGFVPGEGTCEHTLVPVFVPGEHANVPSFRFSFRGNIRMYPHSGFRSGGTFAKTTLLETTFLSTPDSLIHSSAVYPKARLRSPGHVRPLQKKLPKDKVWEQDVPGTSGPRRRDISDPGTGMSLDDRQITHLICVRLKHLLYDFWGP